MTQQPSIAVVIPAYRVRDHIEGAVRAMPASINRVYVVDDACPDGSAASVEGVDPRVVVIRHDANRGVGGATKTGFRRAIADGHEIVVKLDGDGQMDPSCIPQLIRPILAGQADFAKGNRFFSLDLLGGMPAVRLFGNAILSFVNKVSSGYWNVMDPTNGFIAIHAKVLATLPLDKLADRYFFESDLLFRMGTRRAVVADVPMRARYGDERSGLKIGRVMLAFPLLYARCFVKRIFYSYFLRDFNAGSAFLSLGLPLAIFGLVFGSTHWRASIASGVAATTGTVAVAALTFILGVNAIMAAWLFDVLNVPKVPLHSRL